MHMEQSPAWTTWFAAGDAESQRIHDVGTHRHSWAHDILMGQWMDNNPEPNEPEERSCSNCEGGGWIYEWVDVEEQFAVMVGARSYASTR